MAKKTADILAALAQIPGFIVLHSPDGKVAWVNRVGYDLEPESIIGQPSDYIIFEQDRSHWWETFRRAVFLRETSAFSVRVDVPFPPGWARFSGRLGPVVQGDKVRCVVAVMHDVTAETESSNRLLPFMLTPLCRQIVAVLWPDGALKGATIGRRVGEIDAKGQASSRLRVVLASLCERNILGHGPKGYKITPAFMPYAAEAIRPPA